MRSSANSPKALSTSASLAPLKGSSVGESLVQLEAFYRRLGDLEGAYRSLLRSPTLALSAREDHARRFLSSVHRAYEVLRNGQSQEEQQVFKLLSRLPEGALLDSTPTRPII